MSSYSYAQFSNGSITYDAESDRIIAWNTETGNNRTHFGFWSYDYNSNSWEHLGWPDENMSSYSYAQFSNGSIAYGGYFYIGPDWYVSHSGNDSYSVHPKVLGRPIPHHPASDHKSPSRSHDLDRGRYLD